MTIRIRKYVSAAIVFLFASFAISQDSEAQGLRPEQVAVLAAKGNAESQSLADFYCEKRSIEKSRVLSIEFPQGDELDRNTWESKVRPEIQRWLAENDSKGEITHWVTTYGVPLAIKPWESDQETKPWAKFYESALRSRIETLNATMATMAELAAAEFEPFTIQMTAAQLAERFDGVANICQQTVADLPADRRITANIILQDSVRKIAGLTPFLAGMKSQLDSASGERLQLVSQLERASGMREGLTESIAALNRMPPTVEREISIMQLLERSDGLLGSVDWIRKQALQAEKNHSSASLDSELCLVGVKNYRRLGNYPSTDTELANSTGRIRIYDVTRIDGPDVQTAKSLVERAMAYERVSDSPTGNVYVDKRGLPANAKPADVAIETWLDGVADLFEGDERFNVTKDEGPELFDEGQCPDTLVYVGWYGLGKFRDAFSYAPGAVAYHLVPADALWIHDPEDTGWCRGFLENGATFVVGSVSDPVVIQLSLDDSDKKLRPKRANYSDGSVIFGDYMYSNGDE